MPVSRRVALPFASLICAMTGVTIVGLLDNTTLVVPVEVETPVPPEATAMGVVALTVVKAPVEGFAAPIAVFVRPTAE